MELVSVIVPIYKVEKYLAECLDSILASTYTNLEVIVVDDGSPDNCPRICDEYTRKDPRVKVIHQQNQGLVGARNTGLSVASGTYIAFVDSDDAVSPYLYAMLVTAMEAANADMVACEYCHTAENFSGSIDIPHLNMVYLDSFEQQLSVLTCAPSVRGTTWSSCYVWNKLYRRDLIKNEFRKECLMCEDLRFNWDYIHHCHKMVVIPMAMYLYRLNEQSITSTYKTQRKNPQMVINGIANARLWEMIAQKSDIRSVSLLNYLNARSAYTAHGALWRVYALGLEKQFGEYVAEAKQLLRDNCSKLVRDRETYSLFLRFMCWICNYCHPIWGIMTKASGLIMGFKS